MVKEKVLVTGGSGYLGARLCLHLADQGYAVTPLCHSKVPENIDWVSKMEEVIVGDVRDEKLLGELALNKYDIMIHLVSLDHHQSNGLPSYVSSVNIAPVWSLLEIFSSRGLKKFVYFSTAQVYGVLKNEQVTEIQNLNTHNAYALTHQIGEAICDHFNRNTLVECCVIRLSNSYGPPIFEENNCWWLAINNLCKSAYTQKEIVLQSDGTPLRDFIHSSDVCCGVQLAIETREKHGIYNLSSGTTLSIMEIAENIRKVFALRYGLDIPIKTKEPKKPAQAERYELDNRRLRSIGFEPKKTIEEGINDLFDYFEK
ncbi:NAD-dependent epimerase/dehydratase family protein [Cognataquiflexum aquatile]|uniref:NAD-dependent epimerase/dehydratase family protein n=1 Tax=Cognataquiflexum aquatile TaxID=2249427 RepID=UPI000DE870FA|nr:NAD(P)-dependent oxidoreductase [Cognataquiflexum aquatile]